MFLVSSCSCLCAIYWSQVLSWEWWCSRSRVPGNAPTTSEWSTILLPTKVQLILEVLWGLGLLMLLLLVSLASASMMMTMQVNQSRSPSRKDLKLLFQCWEILEHVKPFNISGWPRNYETSSDSFFQIYWLLLCLMHLLVIGEISFLVIFDLITIGFSFLPGMMSWHGNAFCITGHLWGEPSDLDGFF